MHSKKKDPTSTMTLRNRAVSQANRRFNTIKTAIRQKLLADDVPDNAEKVDEFMLWLNRQTKLEILEESETIATDKSNHWLNLFIAIAYVKGAEKTRRFIGGKISDKSLIPVSSIFSNPTHIDRAKLIYTRTHSQLKGVTEAMGQQIARVLADGILQGKGIEAIAKEMSDRVDKIGKVRARLIARTEIIKAHNLAAIKEAENLEAMLGIEVKMLWQTSLDGRERPTHRARHKQIYTKERAALLVGEPNCRCSVTAWIKEFGKL